MFKFSLGPMRHWAAPMRRNYTPLLLCLVLGGVEAHAQNYRGEAVPVVERANAVELSRLRFLTFAFGHEGPMDTPLKTPPVSGRQYFVEADVFGIASAANIRFELVDTGNRTLQTLTLWKASDASDDGEFYGFITVPNQPFRVAVSGTGIGGGAFRSVLNTIFQPSPTGPDEQFVLPPGISADQSAQLERIVAGYRRELQRRALQAAADHPGGVINLTRAVVSRIVYEPLTATSGATIGMRLRYSMQFPSRQTIVAVPLVFPVYAQTDWRGVVEMKPLRGTITPAPQMVGVQSMQDVIVYKGAATYQAGTTYNFVLDLVPDYILEGTQTGRFCINEQKFTNRSVWDALKSSSAPAPYSVSISDTETHASIPAFFPQRTFYESFANGGAFDCGPIPNIRF
jgi:hypothetical protein